MKIKAIIAVLLGVIVILFLALIITLWRLGPSYLMMEGNAEPAEAIIILSGDEKRLEKGVEHYLNGEGDYVILSNSTHSYNSPERAGEYGVEAGSILEEPKAESTIENAMYTKDIMEEEGLGSAVVVTSDYHMRRTRMTFEHIFSDTPIDLYFSSSDSHALESGADEDYRRAMISKEYAKLLVYWVRLNVFN